jgi:hypothetical protein
MDNPRILRQLGKSAYKLSVYQILRERAIIESADYIEQHIGTAMIFEQMPKLWNYAAKSANLNDGLILEFGVFKGKSINHFARFFPDHTLHGFDSFEGLAEDWTGYHLPKGAFDLGGNLPKVEGNVTLHKGWFENTLPSFLKERPQPIRLCHIDCDTYESALYVLENLADRLVTGSIIIFDEYHGYPNWKNGEFKAWQSVCSHTGLKYRYIAFSDMQVAVEIL